MGSSPYSARYIGSLVGDFHRTMLYGGIYGYPGDKKNVNGKLRLIYECAPMSFLAEHAGGAGSTGDGRVLDLQPEAVHQRCPLFIGSKKEVEKLEEYFKQGWGGPPPCCPRAPLLFVEEKVCTHHFSVDIGRRGSLRQSAWSPGARGPGRGRAVRAQCCA